jgi:hypothetical protein
MEGESESTVLTLELPARSYTVLKLELWER